MIYGEQFIKLNSLNSKDWSTFQGSGDPYGSLVEKMLLLYYNVLNHTDGAGACKVH